MLALQEYLYAHGIEKLESKFSLRVYRHPTLPLVGFKYNQIDSPRKHPVVRECRGIVLEDKTWKLVAKPFSRFFNIGETPDELKRFNWNNFKCIEKVDGSLIIVYYYAGEWHANTSGSFGLGEAPYYEGTWRDLFWKTTKIDKSELIPGITYIFELCTPYNRVVKDYDAPTTFLLGVNSIQSGVEWNEIGVDSEAESIGANRPKIYSCRNLPDVEKLMSRMETMDELQEGVVIRDNTGLRLKSKTKLYLALHHLHDNGNILLSHKLMKIVLTNETSEILSRFKIEKALAKVGANVYSVIDSLYSLWFVFGDIASQKKFALKVKDNKFAGILFQMRKDISWKEEGEAEARDYIRKKLLENTKKNAEIIFGSQKFQYDA